MNRWNIACEFGIEAEIPVILVQGKTAEQEREMMIRLNTQRRQLTREQRQQLIEVELKRNPSHSDRRIASLCGVTHKTVAACPGGFCEEETEREYERDLDSDEVNLCGSEMPLPETREALVNLSNAPTNIVPDEPPLDWREKAPADCDGHERIDRNDKPHRVPTPKPKVEKPYDQENDPAPPVITRTKLGSAFCPHGEYLNIFFNGTVYTLESDRD